MLLLTAAASRDRVAFAHAAQHHHVLRGHEENDDQGKQGRLQNPELAKRRLPAARECRHAEDQKCQQHPVEEDRQRLEFVKDERPRKEQAEADDEDERCRLQSELKQPAGFRGKLRATGFDDLLWARKCPRSIFRPCRLRESDAARSSRRSRS